MQFPAIILPVLTSLLTLVAGDACVAGGPENLVTSVGRCCKSSYGKWYQNYPNQAICVVDVSKYQSDYYKKCVDNIKGTDGKLNFVCIPGDGGPGLGDTTTTSYSGRETITA